MASKKLRVCVLQSSYEDVTSDTNGLDPYSTPELYDVDKRYEWSRVLIKKQSAVRQVRELSRQGFDVFLNLCDGAYDEERAGMEVVEALERFGCTHTGANTGFYEPSKELMKKIAHYHSIPTAPWAFIYEVDMQDDQLALAQVTEAAEGLQFPLIVKHHNGYASVGMGRDSKVSNLEQLLVQVRKFVSGYGGALVEQFIAGREFTVLVGENAADPDRPLAFAPVECRFSKGEEFKHFELKWIDFDNIQWVPLKEEEAELKVRLQEAACTAFTALHGCSYGRCDFRVDAQGEIFFLEINPNCGIFYPPEAMGSADFILSLDPNTSHAAFLDLIIHAAQARVQRQRQAKVTEVRYKASSGYGLYLTRDVSEDSLVVKYEERDHVLATKAHMMSQYPEGSVTRRWFDEYAFPLTEEVWVTWSSDPQQWLPLNHHCDPNTWLVGLNLVARRPLKSGEQVTCEYATFCVDNMKAFDCKCGAPQCRGRVTGRDYLEPWVGKVYGGHLSDFVQSKREAMLKEGL